MKTLYFDAEYTCWEDNNKVPLGMSRQVIQIGIVEVNLDTLEFGRQGLYYVKPHYQTEISTYCTELTGITKEDIKSKGRPLDEVMNTLNKFSKKYRVLTWGTEYTFEENLKQIGRINPFTFVDYGHQYHCMYGGSGGVSLTRALKKVGLEFEGKAHNALVDAYNLARLHIQMIKKYWGEQ